MKPIHLHQANYVPEAVGMKYIFYNTLKDSQSTACTIQG